MITLGSTPARAKAFMLFSASLVLLSQTSKADAHLRWFVDPGAVKAAQFTLAPHFSQPVIFLFFLCLNRMVCSCFGWLLGLRGSFSGCGGRSLKFPTVFGVCLSNRFLSKTVWKYHFF